MDTERRLMSDTVPVKNRKKILIWQLLLCNAFTRKLRLSTSPHTLIVPASMLNLPKLSSTLSGIWCTVSKSSIYFRFEREYKEVRGQIEVSECRINIATCHQPNKQMYSKKFMTTTLEEREFVALTGNKSFNNMKKSEKIRIRKLETAELNLYLLGILKSRAPKS